MMFLLYLCSNENIGLFDAPCEQANIIVKQMNGAFSFNDFVTNDVSNLNCCQYLALDLSCLNDTDDALINAIVGIKSIYDFRIIILAVGYDNASPILGQLFAEGIYSIVTAGRMNTQLDEIGLCLGTGMQYKDAIRFRSQGKSSSSGSRIIVQKPAIRQTISVGVSGALPRIGTTKQALHITKFLNESGYTACYIEDNGRGHMDALKEFYHVEVRGKGHIIYDGIDIYTEVNMARILERRYDFLVFDSGLFADTGLQPFMTRDIKIICAGSAPWEAPYLSPVFQSLGDYTDIHFIFSFTPRDMEKEIQKLMGRFAKRCWFAGYAPDFFDGITNHAIYKEIFRPYIHDTQRNHKARLFERIKR